MDSSGLPPFGVMAIRQAEEQLRQLKIKCRRRVWWKLRRLKQGKSKRGCREQRLRRDDRSTTTVTVATVAKKDRTGEDQQC